MNRHRRRTGVNSRNGNGNTSATRGRARGNIIRVMNRRVFVFFIFWLIVSGIVATEYVRPGASGFEEGRPAPETVKAPRDIDIIDVDKTRQLREQAREGVPTVYLLDLGAESQATTEIDAFFAEIEKVAQTDASMTAKVQTVSKAFDGRVGDRTIESLLSASSEQRSIIRSHSTSVLRAVLEERVRPEEVGAAKDRVDELVESLQAAETDRPLIAEVVKVVIRPNLVPDAEETELRRENAAELIPDYHLRKQRGEVIVREGELVSGEAATILQSLGLLGQGIDYRGTVSALIVAALGLLMLALYLRALSPRAWEPLGHTVLVLLVAVLVLFLGRVLVSTGYLYLAPIPAATMLIAILLGDVAAVGALAALAVFTTILARGEPAFLVLVWFAALFAIFLVRSVTEQRQLIRAGMILTGAMFGLTLVATNLFGYEMLESLRTASLGAANGFVSMVLTVGMLPFLESAFGVTTNIRLLEMAHPNQPLLKELMFEAPGTYNHSVMTANLAEAAADQIEANPILARVGAYFHDIGKLRNPTFFVENQVGGENPHDKTNPSLSRIVITSHVKYGVELAEEHRLPDEIVDIIAQHHGTSVISYFFERAKEHAREKAKELAKNGIDSGATEGVELEDYRYPGKKPQTKEAAVVMLADAAEAASRTLARKTPDRLNALIRKIISDKLEDGQLDEAPLTLRQLDQVRETFVRVLQSLYHSRVEYPETAEITGGSLDSEAHDDADRRAGERPPA